MDPSVWANCRGSHRRTNERDVGAGMRAAEGGAAPSAILGRKEQVAAIFAIEVGAAMVNETAGHGTARADQGGRHCQLCVSVDTRNHALCMTVLAGGGRRVRAAARARGALNWAAAHAC